MMHKHIILLLTLLSFQQVNAFPQKPNIILILTDDQGYGDMSVHGSPDVATPNMDKLKSQSISLEDFQVSPSCAPTRSAIMSGRHPFKAGITHTILERERMALNITTLPEVLKRANYTTAIFGKWHLGDEDAYQPENRGFDEVFIHGAGGIGQRYAGSCADAPGNNYFDPVIKHNGTFVKTKGFCTDVFFMQALSWIKEQSKKGRPFFAYLSTNAPHSPFKAPEKYKAKFIKKGYPGITQGYYGMIENIDDNLGILMEKMDEWGISEHTILIFMTDNGKTIALANYEIEHRGGTYNAGMKGYKGSMNEGGTRVPFFIRFPGKFKAGKKIDVLLNHYDILPTFADIAGVDISEIPHLDGRSFYPLLKGETIEWKDRYRFVHDGRWPLHPKCTNGQEGLEKLQRWIGTEETSNPDNYQYVGYGIRNERFRCIGSEADLELYDVEADISQTNNIADQYPEVVAQMKQAYDKWWKEVRPFMVNEYTPLAREKPFHVDYHAQKNSSGIKQWIIPEID